MGLKIYDIYRYTGLEIVDAFSCYGVSLSCHHSPHPPSLQIPHNVASKAKKVQNPSADKELRSLLGSPTDVKSLLVDSLSKDFWVIRTVIQAGDMIMWPLKVSGES